MSQAYTLGPECLVSIIIRTKDRPSMLREALASVVAQHHRPLEVVLINDGGADVFDLADSLLRSDQHISLQYILNTAPSGRSKAANSGLNTATGTFSLFLDDDDLLDPPHISNLLEAHLETFNNEQLGATHCVAKAMLFDKQDEAKLLSLQGKAFTAEQLLYQNCLPIMTILFNTRVREFAQFDDQFDLFEDWDFWLQLNQKCSFHFINQSSCIYRMHDHASNVRTQDAAHQAYQQIYKKWLPQYSIDTLSELLSSSHRLHEEQISSLQSRNQDELRRIGTLHEHALDVIQSKDTDINTLTASYKHAISTIEGKDEELGQLNANYEHAISTIQQKDTDIEKLSGLHRQALDVIAQKDEDIAHLSTLHSEAIEVIAQKDRDAQGLATLYHEATDYIAKLEQALNELNTFTQRLEQDYKHKHESLLKPWYWHLYQALKRKKH